jgi:hypothetical protein
MKPYSDDADFERICQLSLVGNVSSLCIFLICRKNPLFLRCYELVKFVWAAQILLPFFPNMDPIAKVALTYGLGFDFKILEISGCPSVEGIFFRFVTNLIHHLTLMDTKTSIQRYAYAICWMSHLYSWLRLFGKDHWFKNITSIGNFAPAAAYILLVETGEYEHLSEESRGILFMMIIYRGLYINCHFHVFSGRLGICSKLTEDEVIPQTKNLTIVVSLLVAARIYCPSLIVATIASVTRLFENNNEHPMLMTGSTGLLVTRS